MAETVRRYLPSGKTLSIWTDSSSAYERKAGNIPQRASRVEVIESGKFAGFFHADMSLIADIVGNDSFRVCLFPPRDKYSEAVMDEVTWLKEHFLNGEYLDVRT